MTSTVRHYGDDRFGDGTYGAAVSINLHVKPGTKTAKTLTLQWSAQPVDFYRLLKNGNAISSSTDVTKTTWPVSYVSGDKFEVVGYKKYVSAAITIA